MTGRNAHSDHAYTNPGEASLSYTPTEASTPEGVRRLVVDPLENVLIGSILIRRYLGIASVNTMYEWHEKFGLPILKRPDGQWMTTITAIDEWIWLGAHLEREKRPMPRAPRARAQILAASKDSNAPR